MYEKLKSFLADDLIFNSILVVLVAFVAFYLGRASVSTIVAVEPAATTPVAIRQLPPLVVDGEVATLPSKEAVVSGVSTVPTAPAGSLYVASKSGSKYHLVTCGSASSIKEENKIYFATQEEAQAAGYTKAANCPGL